MWALFGHLRNHLGLGIMFCSMEFDTVLKNWLLLCLASYRFLSYALRGQVRIQSTSFSEFHFAGQSIALATR